MSVRAKNPVPIPLPAAPTGGAAGTNGVPLKILNTKQINTFWCWAACTHMVLLNKNGGNGVGVRQQCAIAKDALNATGNCCGSDGPFPGCNRPASTPVARTTVAPAGPNIDVAGVFTRNGIFPKVRGVLKFDEVKAELVAGRPVELCLSRGTGGHLVLAVGWRQDAAPANQQYIAINDPQFTQATGYVLFSEFATATTFGKWVATLTGLS